MQTWYTEEEIHAAHYGTIRDADPGVASYLGGHLEYKQGRGVRQKQKSSCRVCKRDGLDDGKWQRVK